MSQLEGTRGDGTMSIEWDTNQHPAVLIRARKQEGMTRQDLAAKLHVSYLSIFNWETGKNGPQKKNLDALVKLFGKDSLNPEAAITEESGPTPLAGWVQS